MKARPFRSWVVATGTAPLSYQWQKNGTNIVGATAATNTIAAAQTTDAGNYTVVVTNVAGSITSAVATLTVNIAPEIAIDPQSESVNAGSPVSFWVAATGTAPLSYQWRKDGTNIVGATGATNTIATAQSTTAGSYSVVVTNVAGSVTSAVATLTVVIMPPQINSYLARCGWRLQLVRHGAGGRGVSHPRHDQSRVAAGQLAGGGHRRFHRRRVQLSPTMKPQIMRNAFIA